MKTSRGTEQRASTVPAPTAEFGAALPRGPDSIMLIWDDRVVEARIGGAGGGGTVDTVTRSV